MEKNPVLKLCQANLLDNTRKINLVPVANCDNVLLSGNADLSTIRGTYLSFSRFAFLSDYLTDV